MLLSASAIQGQSLTYPLGGGPVATGHTALVRQDMWAIFNNQAAAAFLDHAETGLFTENRFMISNMNRVAVGAAIPIKKVVLMITADHFGGSGFSEMKFGAGCAMRFGQHFSAGLQLDYLGMSIGEGYGSLSSLSFEGGIYAVLTDKLSLGIHLFNPIKMKWFSTDEIIPVNIRGGLGYKPEPSLQIFAEINKSTIRAAVFCAGAEYCYQQQFFIRAGITTGPSRYTFGAGLRMNRLKIDVASSVHSWLGYSPQISFTYSFQE